MECRLKVEEKLVGLFERRWPNLCLSLVALDKRFHHSPKGFRSSSPINKIKSCDCERIIIILINRPVHQWFLAKVAMNSKVVPASTPPRFHFRTLSAQPLILDQASRLHYARRFCWHLRGKFKIYCIEIGITWKMIWFSVVNNLNFVLVVPIGTVNLNYVRDNPVTEWCCRSVMPSSSNATLESTVKYPSSYLSWTAWLTKVIEIPISPFSTIRITCTEARSSCYAFH